MTLCVVGLLLLSLVPLLGGLSRLVDLSTGLLALEGHARFAADPLPAVLHVVGGTTFATLGALQFLPALRKRPWHRRAGRVLGLLGLAAAASGVWMVLRWPRRPLEGPLCDALRITVAVAMAGLIVAGVRAARRGDLGGHQVALTCAYALGAGGGTQAFTLAPLLLEGAGAWGGDALAAALLALGWAINLAVAFRVLRRTVRAGAPEVAW